MVERGQHTGKEIRTFQIFEAELGSSSLTLTAWTTAGGLAGWGRKDQSSEVLGQYFGS